MRDHRLKCDDERSDPGNEGVLPPTAFSGSSRGKGKDTAMGKIDLLYRSGTFQPGRRNGGQGERHAGSETVSSPLRSGAQRRNRALGSTDDIEPLIFRQDPDTEGLRLCEL